ncbi:MAG: hypothetical protein RLZZ09_2251 [Pseudomonadota bacterium]|jgi:subtilisin family serine protease
MNTRKGLLVLLLVLGGLLGNHELALAGQYVATKNPIPNRYIVLLKGTMPAADMMGSSFQATTNKGQEINARYGGSVTEVWSNVVQGFAMDLTEDKARALANDPEVALVEEDGQIDLFATQAGAPWHLDRIDQAQLPLNQLYNFGSTGRDVNAYIIDTGIRSDHVEFAGNRVKPGYSVINDGRGTSDCHGHGTHVAGIVGGATYGVAKEINLYPVRVFTCSAQGSLTGILSAIDWVSRNHVKPAVVNMSLGGSGAAITTAVNNLVLQKGVTVVAAAGNANSDACYTSPANAPAAITVASSGSTDARAGDSNWGTCVDIFAPGVGVTSAGHRSRDAIAVMSGTSMAAPVVTGAVGRLMSSGTVTPNEVWIRLRDTSTMNVISNARGTPNRLVYVAGDGAPPPPADTTPPTVSLVSPGDGQTLSSSVTLTATSQDNVGVARVEFYASSSQSGTNDTLLGSSSTPVNANGRYEVNWSTQALVNGAYAVWAKSIDTNQNASVSPIANVTVFNPVPEACSSTTQVLANAGFESGRSAWLETGSNRQVLILQNSERRSGAWVGKLRGLARFGTDSLSQNVLIPADACSARLEFWFKKVKDGSVVPPKGGSTSNDRFRVEAVAVSRPGRPVTVLAEYREADLAVNTYRSASFDLSAFKGQTVEIRFSGIEDFVEATTFWVDDVSVNVVK